MPRPNECKKQGGMRSHMAVSEGWPSVELGRDAEENFVLATLSVSRSEDEFEVRSEVLFGQGGSKLMQRGNAEVQYKSEITENLLSFPIYSTLG